MAKHKKTGGLTDMQWCFVHEYIIDKNASQAAFRAGYSPTNCGNIASELMGKPWIRAAVDRLLEQENSKLKLTRAQVIAELELVAFASITDYARINASGVQLKSLHRLGKKARAVAKVTDSTRNGLSIEMHNKLGALKMLGEHLGLFEPKREDDPQSREAHESRVQKALSEFVEGE